MQHVRKKKISENILDTYKKSLHVLTEITNITFHSVHKIFELQSKLPTPNIINIISFLIRLGVYSQLVVMFRVIVLFSEPFSNIRKYSYKRVFIFL